MKIIPFQSLIQRYFSGESFVIFDTETTGLNTFHDDIIEIAGVIWGKEEAPEQFQELIKVNPNKMTPGAQRVHQIHPKALESARSPEAVLADFVNFCNGRSLIAHNIRFDFPMLNNNLIRRGLKPYANNNVACSLTYAKEQMHPGKLSALATHWKIETQSKNLHRALYDVHVLTRVMGKMMKANEPTHLQYSLIF